MKISLILNKFTKCKWSFLILFFARTSGKFVALEKFLNNAAIVGTVYNVKSHKP
jgi:hypothetical protein